MHQTIYIDVDEEITSILDRIRQEVAMNVFLVVPKEAMLLNSIINLKLLKKEVDKMGKSMAIVAPNDNRAKNMIERAGIKTEDYNRTINEQQLRSASAERVVTTEQIDQAMGESIEETKQQIVQNGLDIGSSSFFSRGYNTSHSSQGGSDLQKNDLQLGVMNSNRQQSTTVNNNQQIKTEIDNSPVENNLGNYANDDKFNYFKKEYNKKNKQKRNTNSIFKNKFIASGLIVGVLIFFGGGGWYMANYPKVTLIIKPLSKTVNKEVKIIAKNNIKDLDIQNKYIPGGYMEISLKKMMEFEATGSKVIDKNGAKARGVITIENSFSNKPQRLVKTTRVLSKDDKLFRLVKSVIVPGMVDDKPGKIEVAVEADKPGKDFNIDKGNFVIAAWKGTPKGEKFKVYSNSPMVGGVTSADSKIQKVVSKTDLDMARKKTLDALDESLLEEVSKRLNAGQKVIESSIEKEIISSKASHLVGTMTDKFSYTVEYKVKVMVFEEADIKDVVEAVVTGSLGNKYKLEDNFKIETKRGVVDLDKKTITIYADVDGTAWFTIDKDKLKKEISGKNSEETKKALSKDVGVQSAEIKPSPAWSSRAPKNTDKIKIEIVKS